MRLRRLWENGAVKSTTEAHRDTDGIESSGDRVIGPSDHRFIRTAFDFADHPITGLPITRFPARLRGEKRAVIIFTPMPIETSQTLLIDADDTLWENNVYFEQAIAGFIERLNHQHLSAQEVRLFLNQVERETIMERGYGSHSFAHSLVKCFERLTEGPVTPALHEFIWGFAHKVSSYPIELIHGVAETLSYLNSREHHLIVMTKGDITEQAGKVERSGIKEYFAAVEIVAEKNPVSYRSIVAKYALAPETTWMV